MALSNVGPVQAAVARYLRHCFVTRSTPRIAQLAELMHTTPLALSRAYQKETKNLLSRAIRETQIEVAKRLLVESTMRIDVIASACGFASPRAFYRAFRRDVGVAPGTFRREEGGVTEGHLK